MKKTSGAIIRGRATGICTVVALLNCGTAAAQTDDTWIGGSGLWNVASDWSNGVPNNGVPTGATYNAIINNGSAVNLNIAAGINNLTVAKGNSVTIADGEVLTINGSSIANAGTLALSSAGNKTELQLASNVTLNGGGSVTLSNNSANIIGGASSNDFTLTNRETITGAGQIGNDYMLLVNSGIINSNLSAGMYINAAGFTKNSGTLESTAGATLSLSGTFTNTGSILANDSTLQLTNATVNGGTVALTGASTLRLTDSALQMSAAGSSLTNSATGTIEVVAAAGTVSFVGTLINPTGGLLKIDDGASLTLGSGSYTSLGAVQLNSAGSATQLVLAGEHSSVTLSGGSVTMSNNAGNIIWGADSGATLTNQETIQGAGRIGNDSLTLVNAGIISANQSAGIAIQANGGFSNSGTLMVSGGDLMRVFGGTFSNFAGSTLTGGTYSSAGTLEIDQLGTTGGEIVTDAAHIVLTGTGTIVDADGKDALAGLTTIAANSSFSLLGGRDFTTAGNFTNHSILAVGAGSVFAVSGSLTNFSGTTLFGGAYNLTGTLQFAGANIVTNAAKITLTGATSEILNSTGGVDGLTNFATNAAAGSFALAGSRSFTTAGNLTNKGTLGIGAGSTFTVGGTGRFTQTGGTLTDNGTLSASGGVGLSAGSLIGVGSVVGNLASSGNITPGSSLTTTGVLTDVGAYTQKTGGALNISIGGTTAGTFDALNTNTAKLGGTLNIQQLNGFVPTVGSTFKILNFSSETGQFTTVNGLAINGAEHYTIAYQGTDVLLTVASGSAAPAARSFGPHFFGETKPSEGKAGVGAAAIHESPALTSTRVAQVFAGIASHPATYAAAARPAAVYPSRMNLPTHPRLGGKVARGNLQFSLPTLFSRPKVDFSMN